MNPRVGARRALLAAAAGTAVALTACGGGGGGGDSGGAGAGGSNQLVYVGATTQAVISPTNASRLGANVIGGDGPAIIAGLAGVSAKVESSQATGVTGVARRLNRALRTEDLAGARRMNALSGVAIDQTTACDSGSLHFVGDISSTAGTGTLTVTYNACRTGTDTLNGAATMRVDAFDTNYALITDFTITFSRLTVSGPGISQDLSGTLRSHIVIATRTETLTENFVTQDNNTRATTKTDNLVVVNVYDDLFNPHFFTETLSGRVFDGTSGYVEVSTPTPLFFSTATQSAPDSGQILISGAGSKALLPALSDTRVRVQVDANGDGVYETAATVRWADLSGPIGADLRDDDGDGMHNSWERAYGLNPSVRDDALDKDGDGISNLIEYLYGSDPSDPASTPPPVALSVSMVMSQPAAVNVNLTYTLLVANYGSNPASNVVVTDDLPPEVNFVSVTTTSGICTGTRAISCSLGKLAPADGVTITIVVIPTAPTLVSNTARLSTTAYEPNLTDNIATAGVLPAVLASSFPTVTPTRLTLSGVSDLAYDAASGRIFAAAFGNPGRVVPIDPLGGTFGAAIPVGINPRKLARSDDGQYLYVGMAGEGLVQRIRLATASVDLSFAVGSDSFCGFFYVDDMQVLPGSPQAIAAALRSNCGHEGVAVFDNGVRRPTMTSRNNISNVIEFSASADTLYGYNGYTSEFGFRRMKVDASGVSVLDVYDSFHAGGGLIEGFNVDMTFSGGRIYATSGRVIDPVALVRVGSVPMSDVIGSSIQLVAVDPAVGRAFYLVNESQAIYSLRAFDINTLQLVGGVNLGNLGNSTFPQSSGLIRWGAKGLAFRVDDQIYIVQSPQLIP